MTEKQTHYVYRLFAGYELLYVGCTSQPDQRLKAHARTQPWWPRVTSWKFVGPLPKDDALVLETALHDIEEPTYSVSGKEVGRRASASRLANIDAAHDDGRACSNTRCRLCRARRHAVPV